METKKSEEQIGKGIGQTGEEVKAPNGIHEKYFGTAFKTTTTEEVPSETKHSELESKPENKLVTKEVDKILEYINRMMRVYEDKKYDVPEIT
jgi:hypothetical protein